MAAYSIRKKRLLLLAIGLLVMTTAFFAWRDWRVRSIPDLGEPFDVAAFEEKYPLDEPNAFNTYSRWLKVRDLIHQQNLSANVNYNIAYDSWENANEATVEYLEEMRPLIGPWEEGSQIAQGFEIDPREISFESLLEVTQESRDISRIILLDTARLMHEGDRKAVWDRYRLLMRIERHIRNGCLITQLVCYAMHKNWLSQFERFLAQEEITLEELRQFRDDLTRLQQQFPGPEVAIKFEYLGMRRTLAPKLAQHSWSNYLSNEPEVFQRVLSLFYRNWLAHCAKPPWEAPPFVEHQCATSQIQSLLNQNDSACRWDYFDDGTTSEDLLAAFHKPSYSQRYLNQFIPALKSCYRSMNSDRLYQQMALVQLGLHIYYRERGDFPEKLKDLIPDYIDELPRTPDATGAVLTYTKTDTGREISSSDGKFLFNIYAPGTDLPSLFEPASNK
ncbi:hypothetical protein Pla110_03250 [Polystyrenella longa]|uniref:Uncharacterized protein n=1 Tax=Polystyrenella longa TaxID=2528007 RepID=A0A518CHC1_9PLAN|nr:hypothetical protein [Polystyrenella longa]QDU78621.1 hypothetical protein Pla110_03250 [Polystyrenella longa]